MQNSTAFAPSLNAEESFEAFLEKLARVEDVYEPPAQMQHDLADDVATLSYADALRKPASIAPIATPAHSALAVAEEKKSARATIRLTVNEHALLRQRATESGLSISAYARFCVLEVETLRAQVKQMMAELHAATSQKVVTSTLPQTPELPSPRKQPALSSSLPPKQEPRRLQPLTARPPQPTPARHSDPRVQAAIEAQRQLAAQQQARMPKPQQKTSLFSFLFGARKSA